MSLTDIYNTVLRMQKPEKPQTPQKTFKTLQQVYSEQVEIVVSKGDKLHDYTVSTDFYNNEIEPVLHASKEEGSITTIFNRGIESGLFNEKTRITNPVTTSLVNYISKSVTDDKKIIEIFKDKDQLIKTGDLFINYLSNEDTFSFYELLNKTYTGNFTYDENADYLINIVRPQHQEGKTRGASGPGEAFFAYFFNGVKPKKAGDLQINEKLIELKKQGGRIGYNVDYKNAGVNYYKFENILNQPNIQEQIKNISEQNNLSTIKDLIYGKSNWAGLAGVQYPGDTSSILDATIDEFVSIIPTAEDLQQIVGASQLINYAKQITFDLLFIFSEKGNCIGINKQTIINNDPLKLAKYLNSKKIVFKFKTSSGSKYDASGLTINISNK